MKVFFAGARTNEPEGSAENKGLAFRPSWLLPVSEWVRRPIAPVGRFERFVGQIDRAR